MIEIDRRDDRDMRWNGVGGVESSAQTGLQNDDVDLVLGEMLQRERGRDLEEGRMRIPIGDKSSRILVRPSATAFSEIISPFTRMRSRKVTR